MGAWGQGLGLTTLKNDAPHSIYTYNDNALFGLEFQEKENHNIPLPSSSNEIKLRELETVLTHLRALREEEALVVLCEVDNDEGRGCINVKETEGELWEAFEVFDSDDNERISTELLNRR
ncbi:hypothetical protein PIB30_013418 [Stylosanthes scabra]|uniref:Uncharacterized protein n=1 Tax=Stylosanthes scabra TaxID=79078 RepID=A0ABU6X3T6_9FABA|nr:hypothetical protein [Stylosanthes scabra]